MNSLSNPRAAPQPQPERNWFGILVPDPPPARTTWDALWRQAAESLQSRCDRYPRMIQFGEIDREEAEREVTLWRAIKADWLWIMTGEGQPIPAEMIEPAREQLERSITNLAEIAREINAGKRDPYLNKDLAGKAHALIAMAWHYQQQAEGGFDVHQVAGWNHHRKGELGQTVNQRRAFWGLPERKNHQGER